MLPNATLTDILPLFLPIVAMLLAAITVAVLYLWWSGGREEAPAVQGVGLAQVVDNAFTSPAEFPVATGSADQDPFDPFGTLRDDAQLTQPATTSGGDPAWLSEISNEEVEVMRVFRNRRNGRLSVLLEGKQYYDLKEINDPAIGKRFVGNANDLADFARVRDLRLPPMPLEDLIPPAPVRAAPAAPPPVPHQQPQAQPASAPPLAKTPATAPASSSFGTPEQDAGKKKTKEELEKEREIQEEMILGRSIPDEIEEFLQARLPSTPFAGREIHVRNGPSGGILIEVDGKYYEGVGDVPFDDIREVIQGAVQAWEASQ